MPTNENKEVLDDGLDDLAIRPDSASSFTDLLTQPTTTSHQEPAWEADTCGNGALDPGEECDEGPQSGWSELYLAQVGHAPIPITVVRGVRSAVRYYDYNGGSSHLGGEAAGMGRVFLYRSREDARTVLIVNEGGPAQPDASVRCTLDVSFDAEVLLCDSAGDDLCETFAFARFVRAHWAFAHATAGMIVGGIVDGFSMDLLLSFEASTAIDHWSYVDGNMASVAIDATKTLTIVGEPSTSCRADCTRP